MKGKEAAISSSDESDFDEEDDPDFVQVPGGGIDLKTLSQIGDSKPSLPSLDALGSNSLIMPSKPVVVVAPSPVSVLRPPVQKGYEVIRIQPGTSPFGVVRTQNASALQQAITLVRSSTPGGAPIRVNLPMAAVQSLLRNRVPQVFQSFFIKKKSRHLY